MARLIQNFRGTQTATATGGTFGHSSLVTLYTVPTGRAAKVVGHYGPQDHDNSNIVAYCYICGGCVSSTQFGFGADSPSAASAAPGIFYLEAGDTVDVQLYFLHSSSGSKDLTAGYSVSVIEEDA